MSPHALHYHHKHKNTFDHPLSNWHEQQMAARALALAGYFDFLKFYFMWRLYVLTKKGS